MRAVPRQKSVTALYRLFALFGAVAVTAALNPVPSAASFARSITSTTSDVQERNDVPANLGGTSDGDDATLPSPANASAHGQSMAARPQQNPRAPTYGPINAHRVRARDPSHSTHLPNTLALGTNVRRLL